MDIYETGCQQKEPAMAKQAMEGIKIVHFGWAAVDPLTMKYLADHGATVVRIESHTRPDPLRIASPYKDGIPGIDRSGFFTNYNSSNYGVSLNLNKPRARQIAWKLVMWADVVGENYTPGVMRSWGLDYDSVSKMRSDIIYFSSAYMGQSGPYSAYAGLGNIAAAVAGFDHISGWADRGPSPPYGAYTDFINPRFAAAAVIAALDYRRRTGKGQHIDQSQLETALHLLAVPVMDYLANGRVMNRDGNRLPYAAPHGVYPCIGKDRWVAIGVFSDEEWRALCRAMGEPEWSRDARFVTLLARKQNEDELDSLIGGWTLDYTAEHIEAMLQAVRVPCSVVESARDVFEDPQLKHRQHFRMLKHPVIGYHAYDSPSFRLSRTPDCQRAAPALGEHNELVFKEFLKLSDDEIAEALVDGSITTEADAPEIKPHL